MVYYRMGKNTRYENKAKVKCLKPALYLEATRGQRLQLQKTPPQKNKQTCNSLQVNKKPAFQLDRWKQLSAYFMDSVTPFWSFCKYVSDRRTVRGTLANELIVSQCKCGFTVRPASLWLHLVSKHQDGLGTLISRLQKWIGNIIAATSIFYNSVWK